MANVKKTKEKEPTNLKDIETILNNSDNLVMCWKIVAKENGAGYGTVPMLVDKTTGREVTIEDLEKLG